MSEFGYIGVFELIFIFLIVFLVVGPRNIIRGYRAIKEWVQNGFKRVRKSESVKKTENMAKGIGRGLGNVVSYYRNRDKKK